MTAADFYAYPPALTTDRGDEFPIRVEVDDYPQRRWTVLLRILLALPQMFVVGLFGLITWVVVMVGWFAALAIGRLPTWVHNFVADYLLYSVRLNAYVMLLTDAYPPFSKATEYPYPVHLLIAEHGELSRVKVLFRIFLAIPVMVVISLVNSGWWVLALVHWLVVLVRGQYSETMFQSTFAVLRAVTAYVGYLLLLTDRYPWVLYRDPSNPGLKFPRFGPTWILITAYLVIGLAFTSVQQYSTIAQLHARESQTQTQIAQAPTTPLPNPLGPGSLAPQPGADPLQALMAHIPADIAPACTPYNDTAVGSTMGVTAGVHCALTNGSGAPATSYYYFQYQDLATLDNAFLQMTLTQVNHLGKDTANCANGVPSAGSFYYQSGSQQSSPPVAGFLACGIAPDGQAFVDSTDNRTLILTDVSGDNMPLPQLYSFWSNRDLLK
jgi:hypothetical protein